MVEKPFRALLIWLAICLVIGIGGGTLAVVFGDLVIEESPS